MPKIFAALSILATAAFLSLPSPANAAAQSQGGVQTDQSVAMLIDVSAQRRRDRYRDHWHGYDRWDPYWGPRPYSSGYYRPYPYRDRYSGPRFFPFGPWW